MLDNKFDAAIIYSTNMFTQYSFYKMIDVIMEMLECSFVCANDWYKINIEPNLSEYPVEVFYV